jgi:hypothetical protein
MNGQTKLKKFNDDNKKRTDGVFANNPPLAINWTFSYSSPLTTEGMKVSP